MSYVARYRFRIQHNIAVTDGERSRISIPGLPPVEFVSSKDEKTFGTWVILKMSGFRTEEDATNCGRRLGDILSVAGALSRMGIDIGFSKPTVQFSDLVSRAVRAVGGRDCKGETHGLMVYAEDTIAIIGAYAELELMTPLTVFEKRLLSKGFPELDLTDRQRNSAALLNDSFYVPKPEGQFVLRISAVEALCDPKDVEEDYKAAIAALENFVIGQDFGVILQESLVKMLERQKKASIRSSYRKKIEDLLSRSEVAAFDKLYQKRSKLVHDGEGRGDLTQASSEALDLATAILEAELNRQNSEQTQVQSYFEN